MTTSALIMMISVQLIVTGITGYFFFKVLNTPPKTDNNDLDELIDD
ncbi:MAG: hypothetical protein LAT68_09215 [Cyclobacteriaceae bacterium]|nr:hypothetical protein [Cyclobacteriaceae bacterium]MCH8516494.1 hypothetical protein [Cyclobacteriaceae bacterium]